MSATTYFVRPTAIVDSRVVNVAGSKIRHFAHISAGAVLGKMYLRAKYVRGGRCGRRKNVKVQNNVAIYLGTMIEGDVFVGPSCVLTNVTNPRSQVNRHSLCQKTFLLRGAPAGANATIVSGITIGRYAPISAGEVVKKDAPNRGLIQGVPGRHAGWMSRHGHRLRCDSRNEFRCPEFGYRYRKEPAGITRSLDAGEDAPIPVDLHQGNRSYDSFKRP